MSTSTRSGPNGLGFLIITVMMALVTAIGLVAFRSVRNRRRPVLQAVPSEEHLLHEGTVS